MLVAQSCFVPLLPPGSFPSTWFTVRPMTSRTPRWRRSWSATLSSIRSRTAKRSTYWDATRRRDRNVVLSSTGSTTRLRATCWSLTCKVGKTWKIRSSKCLYLHLKGQCRELNIWLLGFSGVGMRLTDVGIATCKKGWVLLLFCF